MRRPHPPQPRLLLCSRNELSGFNPGLSGCTNIFCMPKSFHQSRKAVPGLFRVRFHIFCAMFFNSCHSPGFNGFANMLIEIYMSSCLPSFAMASFSLALESGTVGHNEHVWISGFEAIRDSQVTLGMEDPPETDTDPEKQTSYTEQFSCDLLNACHIEGQCRFALQLLWTSSTHALGSGYRASSGRDSWCCERQSLLTTTSSVFALHDVAERTPLLGPAQVTKHAACLTGGATAEMDDRWRQRSMFITCAARPSRCLPTAT